MVSAWFIPDTVGWRSEPDYHPDVAEALEQAFELMRLHGAITAGAVARIAPFLDAPMARSQRLRVLYLVASWYAAQDPPTPALEPIDAALELAIELDVARAQIDLLLLRAAVNRSITQIPDAADDLQDCLQALVTLNLREDWGSDDLRVTLQATLRLAAQVFLIGAYDECQDWLDHAAALLSRVTDDIDARARYAWIHALLLRWRGDYNAALAEALMAVGHYQTLHDPQMLSRIEATAGDILLDLAERSRNQGDEVACVAYLADADPPIRRALEIALSADFTASEVGARIVRARLQLLERQPGDRKPLLEEMARMAWQHQDMVAVCKAYTGIGRECEAVLDYASAKEWYRRAIAVVKESKAIADAVWAQRALWRLEGEMGVG
jgi:tetratricopeptide (TPR) repeat protein